MKRTILYFSVVISILLLSGCAGRWQSPYNCEKESRWQSPYTCEKEKRYVHPCLTHNGGCVW